MNSSFHTLRWWKTRSGLALLLFGAVAVFFLVTEHRAHALGALPYAVLLLCPLIHFFGHGRHDHSAHGAKEDKR